VVLRAKPESGSALTCALCLKDRPLVDSHIIPEALCRQFKETGGIIEIETGRGNIRPVQKSSLRDRLLCTECEGFVNREYEHPFTRRWLDQSALPDVVRPGSSVVVEDIDYRRFKLFHLLNLWRASAARSEQFANTDLGPHEDRIRRMLVDGEAGSPTEYPVSLPRGSCKATLARTANKSQFGPHSSTHRSGPALSASYL
jgi:hypothetical protein